MLRRRGYNYYEVFQKMVNYACEAAEMLRGIIDNYKADTLSRKIVDMHKIEHTADLEKHAMMKNLLKEFLPPIEREDIIQLAEQIDNATDCIEEVAMRLYMYNIKTIRDEAFEFVKIITSSTETMKQMMGEFPNFRKSSNIHKYIVEMNDKEEEGDRLYTAAMRRLYVESEDPVEIMTWTQVFQCLEDCCDACEDVADIVESIIMKNI
ncbi:MAG: DUF47 family protein [Clostridiales bacterium]|jgi:predicted phosphate transport protein (TIGR00153 family)|nr:DUF47 family protein [Clostridiales bacterium]